MPTAVRRSARRDKVRHPGAGELALVLALALGAPSLLHAQGRTPVAPAPVQAPPDSAPEAQGERRWLVSPPEQELADLIGACSFVLGIGIEFNRAEVPGQVALSLKEPASADDLWDIASRALVARGLTSVQPPGSSSLSVVKLADAASLARLEERSLAGTKAGFSKVLIDLDHDRTESVTEAIKLVLSKHGAASAFKESRSILVSDLTPHVRQALRVAREIDSPIESLGVVELRVQESSPTALAALIERIVQAAKTVFGEKPRGSLLAHPEGRSVLLVAPAIEQDVWTELVRRFDRADPVATRSYVPRRFGVRETAHLVQETMPVEAGGSGAKTWKMVVDDLTGTLVVTATPAQHSLIEGLFQRLEGAAEGPSRPLRSFAIKYRPVEDLVDLLEGMLDKGILHEATPEITGGKSGVVEDRFPKAPLTGPVTPVDANASRPDGTVMGVSAPIPGLSKPTLATRGLGDELVLTADKATNRLIALGNARMLDQLGLLIQELDQRAPQVLVEATVVTLTDGQTLDLGVELQRIGTDEGTTWRLSSLFGLGVPDPTDFVLPPPGGAGFSGVALDPGTFSALARALETVTKGKTRTMPKVLVDNHQTAQLNSVLQTPFASTNASTTVATTSFGGTQDAGTQIAVTPQITEGDQLLLDYTISVSSFIGEAPDPALPPPRQENKLQSVATIPDGFTVVVGGLEIKTKSDVSTQLPLLGSIPILGALFRNTSEEEQTTRMYVFLRATVMRSGSFEDLKHASSGDMARAEVDDGFPKLEPRFIQ